MAARCGARLTAATVSWKSDRRCRYRDESGAALAAARWARGSVTSTSMWDVPWALELDPVLLGIAVEVAAGVEFGMGIESQGAVVVRVSMRGEVRLLLLLLWSSECEMGVMVSGELVGCSGLE